MSSEPSPLPITSFFFAIAHPRHQMFAGSPHSAPATLITEFGDFVDITYDSINLEDANVKLASIWAGAAVFFLGKTRDDRTVNSKNGQGRVQLCKSYR